MAQKSYDCILIPGGGLNPDGSPPDWVRPRLERALALQGQTKWFLALSAGTTHKPPPLDGAGFPIFESRAAAQWLVSAGVEPQRILVEASSYDTIGNAYFARALVCQPLGLARCLVLTSHFHLARVERVFKWVFGLLPSEVDFQLSFEGTPDQGLGPAALAARREKERRSLAALEGLTAELDSWPAFIEWLFSEHQAYSAQAAGRQPGQMTPGLSSHELSSY